MQPAGAAWSRNKLRQQQPRSEGCSGGKEPKSRLHSGHTRGVLFLRPAPAIVRRARRQGGLSASFAAAVALRRPVSRSVPPLPPRDERPWHRVAQRPPSAMSSAGNRARGAAATCPTAAVLAGCVLCLVTMASASTNPGSAENLGKLTTSTYLPANATDSHWRAARCAVAAINGASDDVRQTQLVALSRVAEASSEEVPGQLYILRLELGLSTACANDGAVRPLESCPVAEEDVVTYDISLAVAPWTGSPCLLGQMARVVETASSTADPQTPGVTEPATTTEAAFAAPPRVPRGCQLYRTGCDTCTRARGIVACSTRKDCDALNVPPPACLLYVRLRCWLLPARP